MIEPARLQERISASGLSYSAVARAIGVKQPTISRLVKGEQYNTTRLVELAAVLKTTPAYLTRKTDDPDEGADTGQRLSSDEAEWVELYAGLTSEQRRIIRALARDLARGNSPSTRIHDSGQDYRHADRG